MIELEEAIASLVNAVPKRQKTISLPILDALGCVLAKDVISPIDVPGFAKSAMDGFAVFSPDTEKASAENPVALKIVGQVFAGQSKMQKEMQAGTAFYIATGAAIPLGYNSVVMQEHAKTAKNCVHLFAPAPLGKNICPRGEDVKKGALAIKKHSRITSHHIGILAGMGFEKVQVLRPLNVGIIATGSELCPPGTPLLPGQIYNNSSYAIAAQLKNAGVNLSFMHICPDDVQVFCQMVKSKIDEVDILLTTGGVSVGKRDFLPKAMQNLGALQLFHRVNMQPGTPVMANVLGKKVILGLSGNPFAALVNFQLFFWPMLAKAMQNKAFTWQRKKMPLQKGCMGQNRRRRFVRAFKKDDGVYLYEENHRSSVIFNLENCNCILEQPKETALCQGQMVQVLCWDA